MHHKTVTSCKFRVHELVLLMPIDLKLQGLYTGLLVLPYYYSTVYCREGSGENYGELLNGILVHYLY